MDLLCEKEGKYSEKLMSKTIYIVTQGETSIINLIAQH
jgi:hypothetical protein